MNPEQPFEEQIDTHLRRLAAERSVPVALVEERTEKDPWGNADCWCLDPDRPHYRGTGLCIAAGMVPATLRGVSDVQAEVLEEVEALRREFREYAAKRFVAGGEVYDSPLRKVLDDESRVLRNSWLTRLDRIASAVRRGEQR